MHTSLFLFLQRTAPTHLFPLSLHDALPISARIGGQVRRIERRGCAAFAEDAGRHALCELAELTAVILGEGSTPAPLDRKSTRLNSSHRCISYAVFCLKKKIDLASLQRPTRG